MTQRKYETGQDLIPNEPDDRAAEPTPRSGWLRRLLRSGGLLVAAVWALIALGTAFLGIGREMEQDETYVIWLDRAGWGHLSHYLQFEPSAPLYHYLMKLWIDVGGTSESWVRIPSSLSFLASFPVIWWLGRPLFSRSERLGIFILLVACKTISYQAVFCRYFEMMYLESCVVLLCFVGFFSGRLPRRSALALLALVNFAGLMTHYYFTFCVFAQGLAYLLFYRWRRLGAFCLGVVLPVLVFGAAWGAMLRIQLASGRFQNLWRLPDPTVLLQDSYFARRWVIVLPALILLIAVVRRQSRWRLISRQEFRDKLTYFRSDDRVRVFAFLWLVTVISPFLTAMVAGRQFLKSDPFIVLASFPFVTVLVLTVNRSNRLLRIVCGLGILGLVGLTEGRFRVALVRNPFPPTKTRAAMGKVLQIGQPSDIIVCLDYYYTIMDYYLKQSPELPNVEVRGFPEELDSHPGYSVAIRPSDWEALQAHAKVYAESMAEEASRRPGSRIWVCDSIWRPEFTTTLRDAFDKVMDRVDRIDVPSGAGYTNLVGYQPRLNKR